MKEILKICKVHGKLTIDKVKVENERWRCIECHAKSARLYRERNREKLMLYARKYRKNNKSHQGLINDKQRSKLRTGTD